MIRGRRTKGKSGPFSYRRVLAIARQRIGSYSLSLIEYLWKHVLLNRKWKTKSKIYPFSYRRVLAIVLRRVGEYSLSLIEYL